ncbi:hypothetical protein COP1_013298 [Malus domestica]
MCSFLQSTRFISKAALLSKPEVSDTLIIYLLVSASPVSFVLIRNDGNVERPVYYASKTLQDAETQYSKIEKLALALILQSPDTSGRMIKWAITLGEFDISYQPKPAEKGQAVADFIVAFTYPVDIDCGAGLVLTTFEKVAMEYALRFKFKASNNKAEYEALLVGLCLAKHLGVKRIDIFSDPQLMVNQVTNNFDAKDSFMVAYLA